MSQNDDCKERQLSVFMPERVVRQLKVEAAETGLPVRVLMLRALQRAGYEVHDEDLTDRRGGSR